MRAVYTGADCTTGQSARSFLLSSPEPEAGHPNIPHTGRHEGVDSSEQRHPDPTQRTILLQAERLHATERADRPLSAMEERQGNHPGMPPLIHIPAEHAIFYTYRPASVLWMSFCLFRLQGGSSLPIIAHRPLVRLKGLSRGSLLSGRAALQRDLLPHTRGHAACRAGISRNERPALTRREKSMPWSQQPILSQISGRAAYFMLPLPDQIVPVSARFVRRMPVHRGVHDSTIPRASSALPKGFFSCSREGCATHVTLRVTSHQSGLPGSGTFLIQQSFRVSWPTPGRSSERLCEATRAQTYISLHNPWAGRDPGLRVVSQTRNVHSGASTHVCERSRPTLILFQEKIALSLCCTGFDGNALLLGAAISSCGCRFSCLCAAGGIVQLFRPDHTQEKGREEPWNLGANWEMNPLSLR